MLCLMPLSDGFFRRILFGLCCDNREGDRGARSLCKVRAWPTLVIDGVPVLPRTSKTF